MPSISITEGYTFTNWGPLTTTFTAPASCATATGNYQIGLNTTFPVFDYEVQCSTAGYGDCIPSGTISPTTTANDDPTIIYSQAYLSPGLYCPSGWATKGIAVRDADKSLSSSGILSPSTTATMPTFVPQWQNPATLLMDLLDPSETLVMCCPDSMTADLAYGCYSTVSGYKITEGHVRVLPATDIGISTKTIIVGGSTSTQLNNIITDVQPISVTSRTFSPSEASRLVAVSILPMLSLVHHQSDLPTATSSKTASPTSSASRVAPNANAWLGGFLAMYLVALSASVIFQY
ncbi:uncharacterized protein N7515_006387 [Penicillium bovifimosum]|uniref:Uncharacterized protein n=1 Tax=Penicillium bovifimosum TaxID=126998 RepID=A0A9W9GUV7_9EURO|nr:uncharacterized protein N7515_006387 [Penicillium bovifimosum]KAJ5130348.1 hypothetical protein N7515_006387 [Penicillium bovifimosum]